MSRSAWETTTLGEVCEKPQYGFTASAEARDTGTRFLRITDLREGDLKWNEVPFCTCLKNEIDRYQVKTGDLVVARIGATTGRTSLAVSPPKAVFASYLIRLRPKPEMNPLFLYFFTRSSAYWTAINSSKDSNLKGGVNAGVLTRIEIPKPPKNEQEKIAAVLWKIQNAVEIEDAIVRNARDLKKSLLRYLFTHGLRGEPLKETEIGLMPKGWDLVPLGKLCVSSAFGPRFSGSLYSTEGAVVTLRTTDIDDDGQIDFSKAPAADLKIEEFAEHLLQVNDCVVTRSGTCGIVAVFNGHPKPVLPGAFLIRVRLTNALLPKFFCYFGNSPVGHVNMDQLAQGAIQKNISGSRLMTYLIPLPSLDEQREIADILQTVDRKIDIHESKKRSLQELFKTTLHKLVTAQIRVNDLDIDASEMGTGT